MKVYCKENSKNILKTFFDYYIFTNLLSCFVSIKNNSYSLLSQLHLTISISTLSQSIYNLVKKNNKNDKKNSSEVEKNSHNDSDNFVSKKKYKDEKYFIKNKCGYYNNVSKFQNSNVNSNEEWGWFIYID